MTDPAPPRPTAPVSPGVRWWPALLLLGLAAAAILAIRADLEAPFQRRNLATFGVTLGTLALLAVWWLTWSRTGWKLRLGVAALGLGALALVAATFRIRGVSGDLVPILEPRWVRPAIAASPAPPSPAPTPLAPAAPPPEPRPDYPQFLGPQRTATLDGPALEPDWTAHPPVRLWRQPIGAAWSGFVLVGSRALTQEQRDDQELVTCYDAASGRPLWSHADPARYATTLAGVGPRCTPTVVGDRVFTLGATGILNCLDLTTGRRCWTRNLCDDAGAGVPEWGFSGSPLAYDELVVVSAGGRPDKSLLAYRQADGTLAWAAGQGAANYGSPSLVTLAGRRQVLAFNSRRIAAHDAATGAVLWEYPWGTGQPQVANPVVVDPHRVLFSSGYGVGAELLEVAADASHALTATRVWRSLRMKAKFASLVARDGFLYGLDDGILACLDLRDGTQRWKEGRYGHGQGLLVRDLYLLMAENGELVLLRPTPEAPHELHRFRVFTAKTWNPIALAGDLLLVRNDQEAAALRVPLASRAPSPPAAR